MPYLSRVCGGSFVKQSRKRRFFGNTSPGNVWQHIGLFVLFCFVLHFPPRLPMAQRMITYLKPETRSGKSQPPETQKEPDPQAGGAFPGTRSLCSSLHVHWPHGPGHLASEFLRTQTLNAPAGPVLGSQVGKGVHGTSISTTLGSEESQGTQLDSLSEPLPLQRRHPFLYKTASTPRCKNTRSLASQDSAV